MKADEVQDHQKRQDQHLNLNEGKALVQLARRAIASYLETNQFITAPEELSESFQRKSGVFVTLKTTGPEQELRGCIGFPYPDQRLVDATIKAAVYAATEDPRFPRVSLSELKSSIIMEITVLTVPHILKTKDRKNLPELIEVGRHGLIVQGHGSSGLLLPQVATEWKWDASEFLLNCCLKAGLPPDSWLLDDVEVKVFEGEIFEEVEPEGEVSRKTIGDA